MGTWHVVARRTENEPALVWSDGEAVDWSTPTLPGVGDQWVPHLHTALSTGNAQSTTITTADGDDRHVAIYPADSPTAPAYGAAVWVGGDSEPRPAVPRQIAGLCWDNHDGNARISQALYDMSSAEEMGRPVGFPHTRDPQTLTRKVLGAPDVEAAILQACMVPTAGTISGAFTVLHDHGHIMNFRIDAVVDPSSRMSLCGIVHDVTDIEGSAPPLDEQYRQARGAAVLTHPQPVGAPLVASTITDRHPWMHQTCPAQDLIHPADADTLAGASELIRIDPTAEPVVQVRGRGHDDTWVPVDVQLARYPTHTLAADRLRLLYFHPDLRPDLRV